MPCVSSSTPRREAGHSHHPGSRGRPSRDGAAGYEIRNDFDHAYELLEAGKPLFGFDDHELKGPLQGWRAFAVGLQTSVSAPRVIYYERGNSVWIVAAGEHDPAYRRAGERRIRKLR